MKLESTFFSERLESSKRQIEYPLYKLRNIKGYTVRKIAVVSVSKFTNSIYKFAMDRKTDRAF